MGRKKLPLENGIVAQEENVKSITVWGTDRVVSGKLDVDYYKAYIKELTLLNKLVGTVSDSGNYNLKDRTKRDLVKMDKEIADYSPTYIVAMTSFMGKLFNFAVEIDILDDGMASAALYLNEQVDYYPPVERLHSFVAKVVLPFDSTFSDKVCEVFHLVETTVKIHDNDVPYLAISMQEMADSLLLFDEVSDLGSQIYIMRMLKTLAGGGEKGEEIIEEYKKAAEELNLDENKQGTYSILHRKLDEIIESKGGVEKLPIPKETIEKPRQEYNETIRKLDVAAAKKTAVMAKEREKEAKKEAAKEKTDSTEAKKSATKKADKKEDKPTGKTAGKKDKPKAKKEVKKKDKEKKKKEESITQKLGKTKFTPKGKDEIKPDFNAPKDAPPAEVPKGGGTPPANDHVTDKEKKEDDAVLDALDNVVSDVNEEERLMNDLDSTASEIATETAVENAVASHARYAALDLETMNVADIYDADSLIKDETQLGQLDSAYRDDENGN